MKSLFFVLMVVFVCVSSSAFSSDPPATAKPAELEEQVKQLTEKLEKLEKRLAALEEENKELRAAIEKPRIHVIQAPPERKQERPKFHLLDHTELGVPFSVERAMMGDAYRYQKAMPRENYEYKIEPQAAPIPEFQRTPEP